MIEILEKKLHTQIPLTRLMGLQIQKYTDEVLISSAPLEVNINDKGTAFGGSLSTVTIISSWSMCWLIAHELGFEENSIVIIKNETEYRAPVTQDIVCHTQKPSKEEIQIVKEKLLSKKSASLKISSSILENQKTCLAFEGVYVIKIVETSAS